MAEGAGFIEKLNAGMARIRKPVTWIYCSGILFPLAFAVVAAIIMTLRNHHGQSGSLADGFFAAFYLILMGMLASVPRSILPALLIWLLVARFRPVYDENKVTRYVGLASLLAVALFAHSKIYDRPFNPIWFAIAFIAVALPRLALPSLRDTLVAPKE
jgi:hypothetical protein